MPLSAPVADLVRQFHAHKPARIWSLIVTLYGDAIVPRGGSLWIGSLIDLMAPFGIDAAHVRTAISRLAGDGWLTSEKKGRASYYRFSKAGEETFLSATRRIYAGSDHALGRPLTLVLLSASVADAPALRVKLKEAGFAALSASIHVAPHDPPERIVRARGVFVAGVAAGEGGRELAQAAFELPAIAALYEKFIARFSAFERAIGQKTLSGEEALVARTLMIHAFRRIVLREPELPSAFLPQAWPGPAARALAATLYARLVGASEALLDTAAENEAGPLPPPVPPPGDRFR